MKHTLLLSALLGAGVLLGGCMSEQLAEQLQVQREQAAIVAWRECSRPLHKHRLVRPKVRSLDGKVSMEGE